MARLAPALSRLVSGSVSSSFSQILFRSLHWCGLESLVLKPPQPQRVLFYVPLEQRIIFLMLWVLRTSEAPFRNTGHAPSSTTHVLSFRHVHFYFNVLHGFIVTERATKTSYRRFLLSHVTTDVIRKTGSIEGSRIAAGAGSRIAAQLSSQPQILHGARSSDVHLTHLTSGQTLYKLGNTDARLIHLLSWGCWCSSRETDKTFLRFLFVKAKMYTLCIYSV